MNDRPTQVNVNARKDPPAWVWAAAAVAALLVIALLVVLFSNKSTPTPVAATPTPTVAVVVLDTPTALPANTVLVEVTSTPGPPQVRRHLSSAWSNERTRRISNTHCGGRNQHSRSAYECATNPGSAANCCAADSSTSTAYPGHQGSPTTEATTTQTATVTVTPTETETPVP